MNPELEPEDIDISFHKDAEREQFIQDLRDQVENSDDIFKYHLEISPNEVQNDPDSGRLKLLADSVSKRYYKADGNTEEVNLKIADMKLLLFELITNMYRYDPNGTKIVTIEGDFKDKRGLKLYGRGTGPDVEHQEGIDAKKLEDNLFEIKPGPEKEESQILAEIDEESFKDVQHGRGLEIIAKEAESDHLSVVLKKRPEGEEPSYIYTVLDTPDHDVNVSDLEKIAA